MRSLKLALLFLLFSASLSNCYAVSDSTVLTKKVEHQVFLNSTFFIKQLISLSNANLTISPYIVGYKAVFKGKHALRFSFGGNYSSSKQLPDSSFVKINKSTSVDYRLGYEYQHKFGKRWAIFAGVDVINGFNFSSSRVNSDFDIVNTSSTQWSLGGGPVLGIQFNIHKNIALFTECALYYTYSQTKSNINSVNFPQQNLNKIVSYNQNAQFLLPTSIYLTFKF